MPRAQVTPRLMTKAEAAAYCGFTPSRFHQLVKTRLFPAAIPGTTRWDRHAIDAALDRISGLKSDTAQSALDRWLAEDGHRAA